MGKGGDLRKVPGLSPGPRPGSPKRVQPQSPGLCRRRRYPGYGREVRHNPEGGCDERPNGGHVGFIHCVDRGDYLGVDSSSAPANPIPFRPLISNPLAGTNGTTPCGVGNTIWPGPGVVRRSAQPRAVWHNVVDVGGGEMMRAMTRYVHGDAAGRGRSPFPLWESQRDHDCGDGRGPIPPSGNAGGRAIAVSPPGIRRSCLAPSPSGNPEGILPQSSGLRRRGATLGPCPTYQQPRRWLCRTTERRACGVFWGCVYPGNFFWEDPSSAPANPIPFRPCFPHPPAGTNGTTPCGVGNAIGLNPG